MDDARVTALQSFCDETEPWVDHWQVSAIGRGIGGTMPGVEATETIGLSEDRLLWMEEDLEVVHHDHVEEVLVDTVDYRGAPWTARAGGVALVAGLTVTGALYVFGVPLVFAVLPAILGTFVFLLALAAARGKEGEGPTFSTNRIRIDTGDSVVTVWGEDEVMSDLATTLEGLVDAPVEDRRDGSADSPNTETEAPE